MKRKNGKPTLDQVASERGKAYWLSATYISPTTRASVLEANLILVPFEGFRDHSGPVFPQGTTEFFRFLKEKAPKQLRPEICVDDDRYAEIALHGDLLIIPTIVVTYALLPLAVNLLSAFIFERLKSRRSEPTIRVTVIIDTESNAREIRYEGPASELDKGIEVSLEEKPETKQ